MKPRPLSLIPTTTFLLLAIFAMQQCIAPSVPGSIGYRGNQTDHMALLAIKSQLIDQHPDGVLSSWNHSLHHCFWKGVTCGRKHKRVVMLYLYARGLAGTISPFIGNLSFLRTIVLSNNSLHGQIPHEIGRLFRLRSLYINNNSVTGEMPNNISGCINLQKISVFHNNLEGRLPMGLGDLSKLKELWVYSNHFSGPLFKVIANLTSLEVIHGHYNEFTGTIPDSISRMTNLTWLSLLGNKLTGTIPSSIFNLSSLQILVLSFNHLRGSIPPDIAFTLPRLQYLLLSNNNFSGPFPISLTNLTSLQEIDLSVNNFIGNMPAQFGHLHNLQSLNIFRNNLVGDIKFISSLVNCSKLRTLNLQLNYFTGILPKLIANLSTTITFLGIGGNPISIGRIPIGISNLINLQYLGLSAMKLTRTIPQEFGKLQKLEQLSLNSNRLIGVIPNSFGNLSRLSQLYLDDNQFQGKVPQSLGNCTNLLYLDLSHNQFNGTLLDELFHKTNFVIFIFTHNRLEGSLPAGISKQIHLQEIFLSTNKLSGEIPDVFSNLLDLQGLYLGDNFFYGSVPMSLAPLKNLLIVDLSRNNLSGLIPEYFSSFPLIYLNLSYNNFEGRVLTEGVFANASKVSLVGNSRLCGGILELHLPACVETETKKRMSRALKLTISIICAFVGVLAMTIFIWVYMTCHRRKRKPLLSEALVKEPFLKVSYDMLLKATDGFYSGNLLGSGAFGSVFKGILDGKTVAIKVLNLQQQGGSKSFMAECEALRNIRHRNLVGILTACSSMDFQRNDFKALVYEFMPNGALDRWLHEDGTLSLLQRLDIAMDVAHALKYLHLECETPIVHCDLKPSNILLDHDMVAHVADFGLAKVLGQSLQPNHSSSIGVRGTVGYAAPEYGLGGEVSPEADLYSFGILLLELMTRKRPTNEIFKEDFNLHTYAKAALPDQVLQIVDTTQLIEHKNEEADSKGPRTQTTLQKREECLVCVVQIGVACSNQFPRDRMSISSAINELQQARNILLKQRQKHNLPSGIQI